MPVRLTPIILLVRDFDRCLEFYQKALQLPLVRVYRGDEHPLWAELQVGDIRLALHAGYDGPLHRQNEPIAIHFEVDDIYKTIERVEFYGGRVKRAPRRVDFRPAELQVAYQAVVTDPDGNEFEVLQEVQRFDGNVGRVDTLAILRRIYGHQMLLHEDLYEKSNLHREQHGDGCTVHPSPLAQAPLWFLLAGIVKARRFLEVGCGLGYTAALMAEAGGPDARVDTIESVAEHADLAEAEFSRRGLANRIRVSRGQAREILQGLTDPYDVVFLDASWREYPQFLPHVARLTQPGGVLCTANLFPLFEEWAQQMPHKDAVEEYLTLLARDRRFRTYIIPQHWHALSYRTE